MAICKVDPSHLLPFDFSKLRMVLFKKFLPISKSMLVKNCNSLITYKSSFSELFHFFYRNHGCVCSRSTLNTWICDLDQDPERQIRRFQFSNFNAGPCWAMLGLVYSRLFSNCFSWEKPRLTCSARKLSEKFTLQIFVKNKAKVSRNLKWDHYNRFKNACWFPF